MRRATLFDTALPDLLSQPMQVLAQLQRRAENLSHELAGLKMQVTLDARVNAPTAQLYGHETILVADDHNIVRSIAQEILEGFGYSVLLADSNLHDAPLSRAVDLVMLDVPLFDSEHLQRVRLAKDHAVRLIVCTSLPEGAARNRLRTHGVDDFVSKPYQPFALASCIRRALDLSPPRK